MARRKISSELFSRIKTKLGMSRARVYELISMRAREMHLPLPLAAIALANEINIAISKYASDEDLATIREAARSVAPATVIAPSAPAPTGRAKAPRARANNTSTKRRGTSVWVVHGRNEKLKQEIFALLRALHLVPLEWNQALKKTGKGTPYVGEILDAAFRTAVAVVVLLTPDDDAMLKKQFWIKSDGPHEKKLTGQARANVLFEAGMAFGRNENSTVLVQVGDIRPFSDTGGRHVVRLSTAPSSRQEFATKLANAGCNVNTSGTDWLTVGNFTL